MTNTLARFLWLAVLIPVGCAGTNHAANVAATDVLPFEVVIDGKAAAFTAETSDKYMIGRFPAAHIDGTVSTDAPIEIRIPADRGVVRQIFARCVPVDDSGKIIGPEQPIAFARGATHATLPKLQAPANYGLNVSALLMEGSIKGQALVRIQTRQKG